MTDRKLHFHIVASWAIAAALGLSIGTPTIGAGTAAARSLAAQMRGCAADTDDASRLACYDKLSAGLPAAATASPAAAATTAPSTAATAAPAASSGSIPSTAAGSSEFGVDNGPLQARQQKGKPQLMKAVIASVTNRPRGELVMTLDNGQVWVQLEPSNFPAKAGDAVEINVGAIGSYVMWIPSARRASKVSRVN
jgi:hypothetical protein